MQVKGRHLVLAWGAVFLAVAGTVAVRQHRAFLLNSEVGELTSTLRALRSVHGDLASNLAGMRSPELLLPRAESLGLQIPSDSAQINLSIPTR